MCKFVSWLTHKDEILFLTDSCLTDKSLKYVYNSDLVGHGAIEAYFGLLDTRKKLVEHETPEPLPKVILNALRNGQMNILMSKANYKAFHVNDDGKVHRDDGPAIEYISSGTKVWYVDGKIHREGGPAVEWISGTKEWLVNNKLHRDDGPAVECSDGTKEWYVNDKLHREDGPAVEWSDGTKEWYVNGERHREGGPAIESSDGTKKWYVNGKFIKGATK